ncbi:1-aminocyclopropane-1-carboxylate synthase 7-like protein [Tanacetum coccineum]
MATEIVQLSNIAISETHGENSPYFAGWKVYDENPYHEKYNPSGVIQMGLAENQDTWKQTKKRQAEARMFPALKRMHSMANFVKEVRGGKAKFNPERVVLTAGATAANELLTFILANPGDTLLVPTPYYPGFDRDLIWRTGVEIVPIHYESSNNFQITPEALDPAYDHATSMNMNVRGVLITNPSNPLGATIQRKVLEEILDFVMRKHPFDLGTEIYSRDDTKESEIEIWKAIMEENISPGSSCRCSEAGWFRGCFANMSEETLEVTLTRLHEFMDRRRQYQAQ